MRKWVIPDEYFCAFFSAMGYGFGYSIPYALSAPGWLCWVLCFAAGLSLEQVAIRIIYCRFTQEKKLRKMLIFAAFIVIFLLGNIISVKLFEESLFGNLTEEFGFVFLFEAAGFAISLIRQNYRKNKVKKKYGSGEEGFRFNEEEKGYIEELNQKNTEITGKYDSALAAKTRTGIYIGESEDSVLSFKGIPYAKAPVGALRWKAPEKLPDSDKVFEAKYFGASSIQVSYKGNLLSSHQQSEDCLTLNICTSESQPKEKKPVIVYFHGGDFTYGGSADPLWDMSNFVKENPDVISVSFNYRLGLLGFIDFSTVSGGEEYPDAANLGLLDQIAALEWVKENIGAFGGDPEKITVMGDGAGGISISLLSAAPRAKGLFRKAVLFSGTPYISEINGDDSAVLASRLLQVSGAKDMKELLTLPERRLHELTQELKGDLSVPVCDGKLIPEDVFTAIRNGAARDISYVLCTSRDNAGAYSASIGRGFSEKIIADLIGKILRHQKPEAAQNLKKIIDNEAERVGKSKAEAEFFNLWQDQASVCYLSESLYQGGSSVRMLYWDVDAVIKDLGAGDTNIVSTVLGNSRAAEAYGNVVDEDIRKILQTLIMKVIQGEEPGLYNNEVDGIHAIKWETFPGILAVRKDSIQMQAVDDTLTDAKKLLQAAGLEG